MLYDLGFLIFSIFYLPTLIFRGKLHGEFAERFGVYSKEKRERLAAAKDAIWIQAVSVGEVALCRGLVPIIKKEFPGRDIVFSTITRTGNELARKLFSSEAIVIYFPLDLSFIVKKVVPLIRPKVYIMVETEIWPNVLKELSARSVPSILINGRISDRSFGSYALAKPFLKRPLEAIRLFCMQSEADADRIKSLGAPPGRVTVTGSMKFDFEVAADDEASVRMRESLGLEGGGELFVAGSTHPGEEEAVVSAYKELIKQFPGLRLLIAPRHVERVERVETAVKRFGFTPVRLSFPSLHPAAGERRPVYILDTIGHLNEAYSMATIVFMGGSLIPHGGQNPIEPAAFGKPVIFGPHMFNFKAIASALTAGSAAIQVKDAGELLEKAASLLKDKEEALELGRKAKTVVRDNRGATGRNLAAIRVIS